MKLELRPRGHSPVFFQSLPPGGTIESNWQPSVGDVASLHSGSATVLTKIVKVEGRSYEGEIIGFERHNEYEFEGAKPGDLIAFTYDEVFGGHR